MTIYTNFHAQISRMRGKASKYNCVDCRKVAEDWAWIHGTNKDDHQNYEPKCHKCHLGKDLAGNLNALGHTGVQGVLQKSAKLDEDDVRSIRELHATGLWNYKDIATIFDVHRTNISMIARRKAWAHVL